jgi:hypothetical protein
MLILCSGTAFGWGFLLGSIFAHSTFLTVAAAATLLVATYFGLYKIGGCNG